MDRGTASHKQIEFKSSHERAERVCSEILAEAEKFNYCEDDIFAIHLALQEAFANAINHGNNQDPEKQILADFRVNKDMVDVRISDEGSGFKPGEVPDPRVEGNVYRSSGRGLLLIRSYMDLVEYNEKGNEIHIIKYRTDQKDGK